MTASETSATCRQVLSKLVKSLRERAPHLNEDLPFPQQMAITEVTAAKVSQKGPDSCSTMLSLHAGGVLKPYRLELSRRRGRFSLTVSDEGNLSEKLKLITQADEPAYARDARALYELLTTDLAGHFGTDS